MYLEHFGLSAPPFQFTASPTALFMSRTHRECLAALEWGVLHEPSGMTLLAGETGVGKTTLICALLAREYREVRAAYLGNPRLDFVELLASILNQLGIRGGRASKAAMLNAFAGFAAELPAQQRIAVVIDEAQALSGDTLEDIRLLSNLEHRGRKAAQIILAGQLELARRLAAPEMRHFNERIGARAVLVPLTRLEATEYIEHRLKLCGGSSDAIFARRALDYLVRQSGGVPRRINALCHNSLLMAYADGAKRVNMSRAREAAAELDGLGGLADRREFSTWLTHGIRSISPILGVGLLGAAGFLSGHILLNRHPLPHTHSMVTRTSLMKRGGTPAASIDPGILVGSAAPEHTQPKPLPPSVSSAPKMTVISASAEMPVHQDVKPKHFVVVARGDTLSDIAERYLGSPKALPELMRLNPQISRADMLYIGELVYLPSESLSTTTADATDTE